MIKEIPQKIKSFFEKSLRVWRVLRKPSMEEYKATAKVSALGILIIGLLGFLISIVVNIFK